MNTLDLDTLIAKRLNKKETVTIAKELFNNQVAIRQLWQKIAQGSPDLPFHIAWLFDVCAETHPSLIKPLVKEIIDVLPLPFHNGVHRSLTKVLAKQEIPVSHHGELYSLCIDWLIAPEKHVAIKAHCIDIAYHIAEKVPELRQELKLVLEDQMEFNSAGFQVRAKRVLNKINSYEK